MANKPPTAFVAAIVVLLALPLLVAVGIVVIGLAAGMPYTDPDVTRTKLIGLVVWIALVSIAALVFLVRLLRKKPTS